MTFTVTDGIDHSHKGTVDIEVTNQVPESKSFAASFYQGSQTTGTMIHAFLQGSDPDAADNATFKLVGTQPGVTLVDAHTRNETRNETGTQLVDFNGSPEYALLMPRRPRAEERGHFYF